MSNAAQAERTIMQLAPTTHAHHDGSDLDLARRIEADDRDALRIVMRRHNQMLYRAARSILQDDAEAEDAVQETYVRAYLEISGYRGDAKLSTWLARIAINEALGRLRRRKRTAEVIRMDGDITREDDGRIVADEDAPAGRPDAQAMRAETRRLLERSIDALPVAFRTVFLLRAVEEMTVEETAAALEIPPATVRTRYFRARSLLRESLAGEIDFATADAFAFDGPRCDRIVERVLARLDDRTNFRCPIGSDPDAS
jgi:RNA polymerase sigma-70 factor (ECF subfamily)